MSELSPQARAIVDAARGADEPTLADRQRVRAAVLTQVGVAGVAGAAREAGAAGGSGGPSSVMNVTSSAASTPGAAPMSATKLVGLKVIVGVAIVGGISLSGYFLTRGQGSESAPATALVHVDNAPAELPSPEVSAGTAAIHSNDSEHVTATPENQHSEPAPEQAPAGEPGPAFEPVVIDTRPLPRSPRPVRDAPRPAPGDSQPMAEPAAGGDMVQALHEERTLIAAAKRALDTDDVAAAMRALSEHARKFPRGILAQERAALRVVGLCARGDTGKAANERARFLARWPDSPHADRLRSACPE